MVPALLPTRPRLHQHTQLRLRPHQSARLPSLATAARPAHQQDTAAPLHRPQATARLLLRPHTARPPPALQSRLRASPRATVLLLHPEYHPATHPRRVLPSRLATSSPPRECRPATQARPLAPVRRAASTALLRLVFTTQAPRVLLTQALPVSLTQPVATRPAATVDILTTRLPPRSRSQ